MPNRLTHQMFSSWATQSLFHFGHLVDLRFRKLLTFTEHQEKYRLPNQVFYGYLQIHHYDQNLAPNLQFSAPSSFESIIVEGSARRGLISNIYKLLHIQTG